MNDVTSLTRFEEVTLYDIYASTARHTMRNIETTSTIYEYCNLVARVIIVVYLVFGLPGL